MNNGLHDISFKFLQKDKNAKWKKDTEGAYDSVVWL
jgi:hypothetical protein